MNSPLKAEDIRHLLRSTDRDEDPTTDGSRLLEQLPPTGDRFDALKAAVRRKRRRPTSSLLTPLDPLDSPQHTHRRSHDDVGDDDDISAVGERRSPTQRPLSPALAKLPPLVVNVLERKRLFLSASGEPVVGVEEILQLQELPLSPPKLRSSPLQLIAVPRKVFEDDEVALMPCHTLHYRYVPSLAVEMWKEPVRDRDKNWRDDELAMILATRGPHGHSALTETKMTRPSGPGNTRKGTWRKLDSQRLQIKSSQTTRTALGVVPETSGPPSPRDVSQPSEVLLRVQGAMISKTYCLVTIYGVGIYGRLYSEGLADRPQGANRYLRIDAYAPRTSETSSLRVSLADLEWVFESNPDLLAPGRKQQVLSKVVSLLYFQYSDDDDDHASAAVDGPVQLEDPRTPRASPRARTPPVLCVSPEERLNEAARRRLEREERLRREEAERLRLLALLLKLPKRARHRVVCQLRRVSGHELVVSVYHFPSQVRNFLISAYHPRTSRTLTLAVGVQEAASLAGVLSQPHKWTPAQKTQIATALLPRLRLHAAKTKCLGERDGEYRVALAIREDRMGALGAWLALPEASHDGSRKHEILAKYTKDGQQELQLALEQQLAALAQDAAAKAETLRGEIATAEAAIVALQRRDAELKELIEDINSGKGVVAPVAALAEVTTAKQDKQHAHELRRGHKAARKTIKDESKALQARVAAWKRELEVSAEHLVVETERSQAKFDKALDVLTQRATTATLALWFDPAVDRRAPLAQSQRGGNKQRRWKPRGEIRELGLGLASGACRLRGRPCRFSVFAELPRHVVRPPRVRRLKAKEQEDDDEEDEEEDEEEDQGDEEEEQVDAVAGEWLELSLYDAETSHARSLRLSRLEWLAFTKSQHDAQLAIAALRVPTSPAAQQLMALDESYEASRKSLVALKPLKKNEKKRRQLMDELRKNRLARRALWEVHAPWHKVVRALCDRLEIGDGDELVLDRCIYRATLEIVSLAGPSADGEDADGVVACEVWVTQHVDVVSFHARDTTTSEEWTLAYPDSAELVKEFAVETPLELQLHLEAIAMTLLLYTDSESDTTDEASAESHTTPVRKRKMRFEE